MAKPKNTVDYFPHYCDHKTTMFILEDMYQNDGYALWFKLLELLGKTPKHFIDCSSTPTWKYILSKSHLTHERASEILNLLADLDAIDKELWGYKIIWSPNFIENIKEVYAKRHTQLPEKPSTNGRNKLDSVPTLRAMPTILGQNIPNKEAKPDFSENNHTKELEELDKNTLSKDNGDKSPESKFYRKYQELYKNSNNDSKRIGVIISAFKEWHHDAPEIDYENLGSRIGKLFKDVNRDGGYLLKLLWESVTMSISGSHLDYIYGIMKGKKKQEKDESIQKSFRKSIKYDTVELPKDYKTS